MGFFDEIRDRLADDEEPDEDEQDYQAPAWLEAPEDQLAGVVPVELELARTDEAAIFVTRLAAYDCGFSFELHLLTRETQEHDGFELMHMARVRPGEDPPKELVQVGLELSDGRKAASFGALIDGSTFGMGAPDEEAEPDPANDLSLQSGGGGGGPRHTHTEYWVWPLPPEGPVRFVCEWPLFGIEETSVEIEAEVIRGAAARSRRLWET